MLIDSHCHLDRLDLDKYSGNLDAALDAARAAGVGHMLCVNIHLEDFPQTLAIAERHDDISCSVGIHPLYEQIADSEAQTLVELSKHQKVVAIGETGLDYFYAKDNHAIQQQSLRQHVRAAREAKLPLIIHTRDAREDTLSILTEEQAHECGGVLHCFTESWEMAKAAMDLGFYISFSGIVTFNNADELRAVAKKVPSDRILVETDSPYLAPKPYRGQKNEPAYVKAVAEFVAELRGESLELLLENTAENFQRLFSKARV